VGYIICVQDVVPQGKVRSAAQRSCAAPGGRTRCLETSSDSRCHAWSSERPHAQGLVRNDGSGNATFKVKYSCIAMRLWKDEVVDAVVTEVHKLGFQCQAGPHVIFVSEHVRRGAARAQSARLALPQPC